MLLLLPEAYFIRSQVPSWSKLQSGTSCHASESNRKDSFTLHFIFPLTRLTSLRQSKCSLSNASTTGIICSQKFSSDSLLCGRTTEASLQKQHKLQYFFLPGLWNSRCLIHLVCHTVTGFYPTLIILYLTFIHTNSKLRVTRRVYFILFRALSHFQLDTHS